MRLGHQIPALSVGCAGGEADAMQNRPGRVPGWVKCYSTQAVRHGPTPYLDCQASGGANARMAGPYISM